MRRPARWILVTAVLFICLHPADGLAVERGRGRGNRRACWRNFGIRARRHRRNQSLIDDPHQGEKASPGVIRAAIGSGVSRQDQDRPEGAADGAGVQSHSAPGKGALPALVQASREVIRDAQVVINQRGIGYKEFHSGHLRQSGLGAVSPRPRMCG